MGRAKIRYLGLLRWEGWFVCIGGTEDGGGVNAGDALKDAFDGMSVGCGHNAEKHRKQLAGDVGLQHIKRGTYHGLADGMVVQITRDVMPLCHASVL